VKLWGQQPVLMSWAHLDLKYRFLLPLPNPNVLQANDPDKKRLQARVVAVVAVGLMVDVVVPAEVDVVAVKKKVAVVVAKNRVALAVRVATKEEKDVGQVVLVDVRTLTLPVMSKMQMLPVVVVAVVAVARVTGGVVRMWKPQKNLRDARLDNAQVLARIRII